MAGAVEDGRIQPILDTLSRDAGSLLQSLQSAFPDDSDVLETRQGPSLLTLKNITLLNYLHHLILLCSVRLRGRSMDALQPERIVRTLIETRLVLEKIRPVEGRMRSLVDRLLRAADDEDKRVREGIADEDNRLDVQEVDPLAFRPNLAALSVDPSAATGGRKTDRRGQDRGGRDRDREQDGVYRPPRLAPVVYNPESSGANKKGKKERIAPRNAALLSDLSESMSSNPYEISSGGVGVGGSGAGSSSRAKALARIQKYEEDNFTRTTMSKRDAKRRRRDEADVALGGAGMSSKRGRIGAGLEEEFGDLLRNSSNVKNVKRSSALQRARSAVDTGKGDGFFTESGAGAERGGRNAFQRKMRNDKRRR